MMLPPPASFICGTMFCVTSVVPTMLTERMSCHSAGVASTLRKMNRAAQFTRIATGPSCSRIATQAVFTAVSSEISTGW